MTDTDDTSASPLEQSIESARGITTLLGGVFLVGGVLQALGWVEAGVPAWLNIVIPVVILFLAPQLKTGSLFVAGSLVAIFLVLVVDTLAATIFVFNSWGAVATVVVVVRYVVLLSAAQELGQVLKILLADRQTERRVAELKRGTESVRAPAPQGDTREPRSRPVGELKIDVSNNSSAMLFRIMSGLLLLAGIVFGSAMAAAGETGVAMFGFLLMPALAIGTYLVAGVEERYLPGLIETLKKGGDPDAMAQVHTKLVAAGRRGSRALAAEIVNKESAIDKKFSAAAVSIIAEIGVLDGDAAFALRQVIAEDSIAEALRPLLAEQEIR